MNVRHQHKKSEISFKRLNT